MLSVSRWNPIRDMLSLHEAMDRLNGWSTQDSGEHVARLPVDAYSTDNEIVVIASLPGVKAEDVDISVEGDTLTIKGEIPAALENVNGLISERYHGPFRRTLQLNVAVDVENIEATFEAGELRLVLPKSEEVRPKQIKVKAS